MIIALTGLPRVGKDTIADALVYQKGFIKYAFAQPIKRAVSELFGWSLESFEEDNKDIIDPFWGVSKRQILEYIGSEVCRNDIRRKFPLFDKNIGENIWVKRFLLFREENSTKRIIISDLRFLPEYKMLKSLDSIIIRINRMYYNKLDPTKAYDIPLMEYDYILNNDIEGDKGSFIKKSLNFLSKELDI